MATLQIRDLPDALYRRLKRRAEAERRSLAQEATVLLEAALADEPGERRREALRAAGEAPVPLPAGRPSPEALIQEDRAR